MREIKFRGKRVDNGEWVYGYYVKAPTGNRIYWKPFDEATSNTYHLVIPESIGQFTGLKDKNGKEIYEGDVLCYIATNMSSMEVKFENGCFVGEGLFTTHPLYDYMIANDFESIEIIGNIHQNPVLK